MENSFNQLKRHTDPDRTNLTNTFQNTFWPAYEKIDRSEQRFILEAHFPPFTVIRTNSLAEQEPDYRYMFLEDIEKYPNQERMRIDFLNYLDKEYCTFQGYSSIKAKIQEFEEKSKDWEIDNILEWYAKDDFLKQILTDALNIGAWNAIHSCRWILQSLKSAIKEQKNQFSGMLCSVVLINGSEWEKLQKGIGKQIQLYGFLSAEKIQDEMAPLVDNERTLLSIIVPPFHYDEYQGRFAKRMLLKEGKQSEEILFNIISRFRILEAKDKTSNGSGHRHLVLLYGDDEIQSFVNKSEPIIEIKMDTKKIICKVCAYNIDIAKAPIFYIDFEKSTHYFCEKCTQEYQYQFKSPLLCVYPATQLLFESTGEQSLSLLIDGIATQYQLQDQNIPFYGYKCLKCQKKDVKYFYKCLSCLEPNKTLCEECINYKVDCVEIGHIIILECQPFTFWPKCNSEEEFDCLLDHRHPFRKDQISQRMIQCGEFTKHSSKTIETSFGVMVETPKQEAQDNSVACSDPNDHEDQNEEIMTALHELFTIFQEFLKYYRKLSKNHYKRLGIEFPYGMTDNKNKIKEHNDDDNLGAWSDSIPKEKQKQVECLCKVVSNSNEFQTFLRKLLEKDHTSKKLKQNIEKKILHLKKSKMIWLILFQIYQKFKKIKTKKIRY